MKPGQFAVVEYGMMVHSRERPIIVTINEVTPKTIRATFHGPRTFPRSQVMATFDERDHAARLVNTIAGIRGEKDRRVQAAQRACSEAINAAVVRLTV